MMLEYFTDPVLRAPTIGSMLMCFVAGIVGVIVFLRKESLLGEALSHATYPGVILGVLGATLFSEGETFLAVGIFAGSFFSAFLGLWAIQALRFKLKVPTDAALCFVLSVFFGVGLTLASRVQFTHTSLYQKIQIYLYGQAATMNDTHILIYSILSVGVLLIVTVIYKELQVMTLDRAYAKSLGIPVRAIDLAVCALIVLAVIIGIRSVGVVLISAMLIAPAAAARQFTNKLYAMLFLSALFGIVSGFLGNVLSVELSSYVNRLFPNSRLSLPTGPVIVLVASVICVLSLLLAPERGLLIRLWRIILFRYRRLCENILKSMWYSGEEGVVELPKIQHYLNYPSIYMKFAMSRLIRSGWIRKNAMGYSLTKDGFQRASHIVRLHRLWEVYLVDFLGVGAERVHCDAEEMEHVITPEIEAELIELLNDPKRDPHHQKIPQRSQVIRSGG